MAIEQRGEWRYVLVCDECGREVCAARTCNLLEIPAADVEPVVRCGKCKYAQVDTDGFVETCEYWNEEFNTFHLTTMHPDGYCSNGVERSGSGE